MSSETFIAAHKKAFLTTQIRRLGTPLTRGSYDDLLPAATVDKIIESCNKRITAHNHRTFFTESRANVVQQIADLYVEDALKDGLPSQKAETCIRRGVDLTDTAAVLPESWSDVVLDSIDAENGRVRKRRRIERSTEEPGDPENPTSDVDDDESVAEDEYREAETSEEAESYSQLRAQLVSKIEYRDQLRRKLAEMKRLQNLLEPFEDPKQNIQPNLVTKDNKELEQELSKMRILMAKVGSNLSRQKLHAHTAGHDMMQNIVQSDQQKMNGLLTL